jgi:hypothetical protein
LSEAADHHAEPRYTLEYSEQYGRELADAVEKAMRDGSGRVISGGIRAAFEEVPLPFEPLASREQLEANLAGDDEPADVPMALALLPSVRNVRDDMAAKALGLPEPLPAAGSESGSDAGAEGAGKPSGG